MLAALNARHVRFFQRGSRVASAVAVLAGGLVLVGWSLDLEVLKRVLPGLVAMNPVTAVCFVLCGIALSLLAMDQTSAWARATISLPAAIVAAAGLLKLGDVLFGWHLEIDRLLFASSLGVRGSPGANGMSPATALDFALVGSALLLLDVRAGWAPRLAQLLSLAAGLIALLVLMGYAYNVYPFATSTSFYPMALHTAVTFVILTAGVLFSRPERGIMAIVSSDTTGGLIARRLLPAAVAVPALLGWLRLQGERAGLYETEVGVALFALATTILLALLVWWNAGLLHQSDDERRRAEAALQEANAKLTGWVSDLEQRHRDIVLLSQGGNLLQAAATPEEVAAVIARSARELLPAESGLLGLRNASRNLVEAVAVWGEAPPPVEVFAPDACWALRRGREHVVSDTSDGPLCQHLNSPPPAAYLCVPLIAQGDILGVLHLQTGLPGVDKRSQSPLSQTTLYLATAVAEQAALAFSNVQLRESLRQRAIRDPLTGLFNRRYMEESFERELRRSARSGRPIGVIMLDIDHFKQFNDTFGHAAGDMLLQEVGNWLKTSVRGGDVACRYGGEEFTLILPEASLEDTRRRAEELREAIGHIHVQYRDQPLGTVTLSLGVAAFPDHGETVEALLRVADAALYRAKQAGRNRVEVATMGAGP